MEYKKDDLIDMLATGKMSRRKFQSLLTSLGVATVTLPMWPGAARAAAEDHPNVFTWEGWDAQGHHLEYHNKHGEYPNFSIFGTRRKPLQDEGGRPVRRDPPVLLQGGDMARRGDPAADRHEPPEPLGRDHPEPQGDPGHDLERRRLLRRGGLGPHLGPVSSRPRRSQVPGRRDLGTPVGRALCRAAVDGGQPHRRRDGGRDLRRGERPLQHDRRRGRGHARAASQAASPAALLLVQPHRSRELDGGGRARRDQLVERRVHRAEGGGREREVHEAQGRRHDVGVRILPHVRRRSGEARQELRCHRRVPQPGLRSAVHPGRGLRPREHARVRARPRASARRTRPVHQS